SDGHERDERNAAGKLWIVAVPDWVILEQKRDNVGVNNNPVHAAGLVRPWPLHSWSVSRNSSMDSSPGQKSPRSTFTSVTGPVPCCSTRSSIEGWPVAE